MLWKGERYLHMLIYFFTDHLNQKARFLHSRMYNLCMGLYAKLSNQNPVTSVISS